MSSETVRYTNVAIGLHWLIALMLIGQIAGGWYMTHVPEPFSALQFQLYQLHKSFGLMVLFLSLIRLGWRLSHKVPGLPDGMKSWERIGARISHIGFYVLMIGVPLGGWAVVSASPFAESVPTLIFGVVPWPHLPFFVHVEDKQALYALISRMHMVFAFTILALFFLHVGAALKHHFIVRDGVLARMAPFLRSRGNA
ncbi:MAG: cytochrome b [Pseudomonadota bacterium]